MRRVALGLGFVLLACGARTELYAPHCDAMARKACRTLAVRIPRALLADDAPRWPRLLPRGDGLDLVLGDPGLGTRSIARRMHVLDAGFDVGPPVVLDDFAACPLAATANRLGAQCDEIMLYDGAYQPVSTVAAGPSTVGRNGGTFVATANAFHVAWVASDASIGFATVDESGLVTPVPSPFAPGLFEEATLTTTTCDGVVRGAARFDGTLDVQLATGVVSVALPAAHAYGIGLVEWPYSPHAVAFLTMDDDMLHETLHVVDGGGERSLPHLPTDGTFFSVMVPMPWGLVLINPHLQSVTPPQVVTLDVEVVDASGVVTAKLTLPTIPEVDGGVGFARSADELVIGWGEPTGTYATTIGCAD